jgi:superfamily II DNA or RNA helicase
VLSPYTSPVPRPDRRLRSARRLLAGGQALDALAREVLAGRHQMRSEVVEAADALHQEIVRRELATTPIDQLTRLGGSRLPLKRVERAGLGTVQDVLDTTPDALAERTGLSPAGAAAVHAAARELAAQLTEGLPHRIDLDPGSQPTTRLVVALHRLRRHGPPADKVAEPAERIAQTLPPLLTSAARAGTRFRRVVLGRRRRTEVDGALSRVEALLTESERTRVRPRLAKAAQGLARRPSSPKVAWRDFEKKSPEYYGSLEGVAEAGRDLAASRGRLPTEVAEHVERQELDDSHRRVALRGYQAFGARFALAQRRVVLGDEMGLGKTIQAIAAMAHLVSIGRSHFLVVCPASVVVNWTREIGSRSRLRSYRLHGSGREEAFTSWVKKGGVAVTTFEALRALPPPSELRAEPKGAGVEVSMLVVDEAHYVKNPGTQRSTRVAEWAEQAERVLFLTGTPMENKVREFTSLVGYLQPHLTPDAEAAPGPASFRRAVAPAYLRRNQEDVLRELPALVRVQEWVEFGVDDSTAYERAVEAGNFMAMRRAAYQPGTRQGSAKLNRLCEIVEEATGNGRKVVVFSNFRAVLAAVAQALQPITEVLGPVSGSVPATHRQTMVDEFSARPGGAVLVSQIQAGGVGLNMQAASVVVICEPQVKPTIEDQAVARAHRMGQVRSVQVHRLLVADSVDERMLELLSGKVELFDDHARRSETADATTAAVDISDAELARRVVAQEQQRLSARAGDPTALRQAP